MKSNQAKLAENIINMAGKEGQNWIESLPTVLDILSSHWHLTHLTPVNNMTYNYVSKALNKFQEPVILKISLDKSSILNEKAALQYFAGNGSIRIIDYYEKYNSMLLHCAVPGKTLKLLYPQEIDFVMDCYVNTINQLHAKTLSNNHGFQHIRDWLMALDNHASSQLSKKLLHKAILLKNSLLESPQKDILLHGDLHHDNILQDGATWLAIDPKGIVGEAEFEIAAFDFIHPSEMQNVDIKKLFHDRIYLLAQRAQMNPQRIKDWVFVRLILSAAWSIEDKGDPSRAIKLAEFLI